MVSIFTLVLVVGVILAIRHSVKTYGWQPAIPAALAFAAALVCGAWSILQSRSSTAGIGFLFLPFYALIPAAGGLLFGVGRKKSNRALMAAGTIVFAAATLLIIKSGLESRALNAKRDGQHKANLARQRAVALELKQLLSQNKGQESSVLAQYLQAHPSDRAVDLEILATPYVSPELLEEYAKSDDMGILLSVIRNANVTPEILENIYAHAQYKDYYHADLARNAKTPTRLLLEVAKGQNTLIPAHLINNPNSTCEVLKVLNETVKTGYLSEEKKTEYALLIEDRKKLICP
jgi:hypothetical protein